MLRWTPFVTNNGGTPASAESVFLSGIASGEAYFNIHTAQFLGGEIRGFLARARFPTRNLRCRV
ncbi:MAG: CHRD domain-containing protein [Rhodocyclaceae bacterium]|nr:CHRD domain-containing protein [Rhodocyclaceae bacterium]